MKKPFVVPEIELIFLNTQDIIRTSNGNSGSSPIPQDNGDNDGAWR